MPSPKNETLANMMRRMSTNSPVKKSAKTTKKTPVKKSSAEEKQKKRVEAIVKLMEKDKTYIHWIHGARPKGYKRPSTIDGSDEALNMRFAEKLFLKRRKAAEGKREREQAKERVEAQRRYEAEKEQREQERKANNERQEQQKKAENLAMNTARNLFNTLKKAKDQKSIRQAFFKGALKLHPNKGGDAELYKKFKAIYNGKKM